MRKDTKRYLFEAATAKVAANLSELPNPPVVVFMGTEAHTNGDTIFLPAGEPTEVMTGTQCAVLAGYVDHESAHLAHTDMTYWKETVAKDKAWITTLTNCLEDMRIEALTMARWTGTRDNLDAVARAVNTHSLNVNNWDEIDPDDVVKMFPVATTWGGRQRAGLGGDTNAALLEKVSDRMRGLVDDALNRLAACRSVQDVHELAQAIAKELEVDEDTAEEAIMSGELDCPELKAISHDYSTDGSGRVDLPVLGGNPRIHTRKDARGRHMVYDPDSDTMQDASEGARHLRNQDGLKFYEQVVAKFDATSTIKGRRLQRALMSHQDWRWRGGHEYGRLDTGRLVDAVRGVPTVFQVRQATDAINTAVEILVDCSGSMSGQKIDLAQSMAVLLAHVLNGSPVAHEITGFTDRFLFPSRAAFDEFVELAVPEERRAYVHENPCEAGGCFPVDADRDDVTLYSALESNDFFVFKGFTERLHECKTALGNLACVPLHNNDDAMALRWAWSRLAKREERRKVMLVLSDGQPSHMSSLCEGRASFERTLKVIGEIEKAGVEIIGIGLGTNHVQDLYKNHMVVSDYQELNETALGALTKLLGVKI